ncbi:glycosyl transferase family 2 [Ilumatobacter fluminis]|uniref:Glycosyl transferase family 2 n=1 Tax=Ilumatobacter fluminis TaxID=467091 RepID=A0A4R7HX52_9ACTN|nr:glycosyltransferase [Ilumatobacter fluminis]TDT15631.1 glycosyl transferase family 2 [Ilumatobacter fluminis]
MTRSPSVAVVVPVLDRPMVTDAVDSALAAIGVDVEIVVVDDGSGPETSDLVDRLAAAHPAVSAIHQPNRGQSAARNTGVASSVAPVVAFLDSDDLMVPDRLVRQIEVLTASPDRSFVLGQEELVVADGVQLPRQEAARAERGERTYFSSVLLRRSDFESIGGYDESLRYGEDIDLVVRLTDAGLSMVTIDDVVVRRRIHGDNLVMDEEAVDRAIFEVYRRRARRRASQDRSSSAAK